jgi:hypothetical protein
VEVTLNIGRNQDILRQITTVHLSLALCFDECTSPLSEILLTFNYIAEKNSTCHYIADKNVHLSLYS